MWPESCLWDTGAMVRQMSSSEISEAYVGCIEIVVIRIHGPTLWNFELCCNTTQHVRHVTDGAP